MSEESLGERIRQARQQRKWSQETLAAKLEVATRTVLRWEIKDELPNNENQQRLIDLLGFEEKDFRRESQQISEIPKQEMSVSPITISEFEQMLPPKEDFKMYCGRRIYRRSGKYSSRTTYVTVNGRLLKYFGSEKRNLEKETVFEWGYRGAGPSQLAVSILADYLGESYPEGRYASHYESNALLFKALFYEDFIVKLPRSVDENDMDDDWQITSTQIRRWFYLLEEEGITGKDLLKNIYGEDSN